ncbi:putative cytokinetic ring protein SteA [Melghirimyces algeriensis]|uniref:Uncharacterized membrane-anchored protein n=1 Tax=Melghirimyces algeriensis TaxID=910412 RepID=A0A521B0B6_9BACL|nr:putative cytokinetic ring protein SteA [Melghirimyces algeriensis]SMO40506.1 Uncharacterized membrane-anchored protein [Melghirimyces algeriensis]
MFTRIHPSRKRVFHGTAVVDEKTKCLVHRIRPGQIAVINHQDLDEVAADALIKKRVKGVVNCAPSISGRYPAQGPYRLVEAGIPLLDDVGMGVLNRVKEGDDLCLHKDRLYRRRNGSEWVAVASGYRMTDERLHMKMEEVKKNIDVTLHSFVNNTLRYATEEQDSVSQSLLAPKLDTPMKNRHVMIVVRGKEHEKDLKMLRPFLKERKPVLIGVDGGADSLIDQGFHPDIILGDMDSVTDDALMSGAELIVHAYLNGKAPGLKRVKQMGLKAHLIPFQGTSEDVAMLLAYEKGAERIIILGSHSNMVDFLEKGRMGMASTFLTRMKVGSKLVDIKGISQLYRGIGRWRTYDFLWLTTALVFPVTALALVNPRFVQVVKLLWLNMKIFF